MPDEATGGRYIFEILATRGAGTNEYATSPPGQSSVLDREDPGAPPLIPNSIVGLAVTKDQNACLTCHEPGLSLGPDHIAVKVPESHFIDLSTGLRSETLQGTRYCCLLCHIPQSAEAPLR